MTPKQASRRMLIVLRTFTCSAAEIRTKFKAHMTVNHNLDFPSMLFDYFSKNFETGDKHGFLQDV